jgi:hypothetical protein
MATKPKSSDAQAVLVTTEQRGVFFGYVSDANTAPEKITLTKMRNCIQWRGLKGFLDLTTTGPTSACRVGPAAAEGTLYKITGVWKVEPAAVKAWEDQPWAR